jgi:hypothetical protein
LRGIARVNARVGQRQRICASDLQARLQQLQPRRGAQQRRKRVGPLVLLAPPPATEGAPGAGGAAIVALSCRSPRCSYRRPNALVERRTVQRSDGRSDCGWRVRFVSPSTRRAQKPRIGRKGLMTSGAWI